MIDIGALKDWLGLFAVIISVGTAIWTLISSGAKRTATELEAFKKTDAEEKKVMMTAITRLADRTLALEKDFEHMPDREMVHKLQNDLTELKGQVTTMVKSSEATERAIRRVEDFLMDRTAA
jgi:uncharacterized protein HemX